MAVELVGKVVTEREGEWAVGTAECLAEASFWPKGGQELCLRAGSFPLGAKGYC